VWGKKRAVYGKRREKKDCIWAEKPKKKFMYSTCNESFLEVPAYNLKKK